MGTKVKDGKNQRTVLSGDEISRIEDTFINQEEIEDFSVKVAYEQVKGKNYSFSAGQYFDVQVEFIELSKEEFEGKINNYSNNLEKLFIEGKILQDEIKQHLGELYYD